MELRYKPEVCLNCDEMFCLRKCLFINYDERVMRDEVKKIAEGERSKVLEDCTNCYACEEFCPYDNHFFYRICELQEKYDVKKVSDDVKERLLKRYEPVGEFIPKVTGKKLVHICLFPHLKDFVDDLFFEGFEIVRGRHLFCNIVYLHYGMISVIKERASIIVKNMRKLEPNLVVLFHDECYGFYQSFLRAYGVSVDFKFLHLFEYLKEKLVKMSPKRLDFDVIYQRPCSNRLSLNIDKVVDEIFEIIGVRRIDREYDREKALCCGASFILSEEIEKVSFYKKMHEFDFKRSNAPIVVFNCPMCYNTLKDLVVSVGKKPLMLIELCKLAVS